ncbi:MAG: Cof-type HAD-IIB family hydrolase [Bacteroidota bacterium]
MSDIFKLAFIDLDGTLLDPRGLVTPRARAALVSLAARGVTVVLATGRPPRLVRRFQDELGLAGPAICYNGGLVVDFKEGVTRHDCRIPGPEARSALDVLRRENVCNLLCEADDCLTGELTDEMLAAAQRDGWGLRGDLSMDRACASGVHKLIGICPPGMRPRIERALESALPGRLTLVGSAPGTDWLEILPAGVSKAAAAEVLAGILGIDLAEAMAFGDAENDAALLARVGLGVAMANGDDWAKAAARRLAPPNGEEGFARAVEELLAAG